MEKRLQNLNNSQMMAGAALFSTAALSVYSIKSIVDINKKINEIHEDMEKIKQFITENQRKNNITVANLGKRMEEVQNKIINLHQPQHPPNNRIVERIVEIDDVDDEVNNFLN